MDYCQIRFILHLVFAKVVWRLDEVLCAAVGTKNRGIRWDLSEDLDYADEICLLSLKASDMQYKLNDPVEESAKVGLKLN